MNKATRQVFLISTLGIVSCGLLWVYSDRYAENSAVKARVAHICHVNKMNNSENVRIENKEAVEKDRLLLERVCPEVASLNKIDLFFKFNPIGDIYMAYYGNIM